MNQKIQPIPEPTLFEMDKLDKAADLISSVKFERPLFLGTRRSLQPDGPRRSIQPVCNHTTYLAHYSTQFRTVEIDRTFYGTPSASTVAAWKEKTLPDFVFAAKIPQVVTHEKVLVDCDQEFDESISWINLLGEKLAPLVLQFPYFSKAQFQSVNSGVGGVQALG